LLCNVCYSILGIQSMHSSVAMLAQAILAQAILAQVFGRRSRQVLY
jgi:hypothetical protein